MLRYLRGLTMLALVAALTFTLGPSIVSQAHSPEANADRVVTIVIDGARPDVLRQADTPNIDRLRRGGVTFEDARSSVLSATQVGSAEIATGTFPEEHGIITEHYVDRDAWETVSLRQAPDKLDHQTIFQVLDGQGMTSSYALGKFKLTTGAVGATNVREADVTEAMDDAHFTDEVDGSAEKAQELRDAEDKLWTDECLAALENDHAFDLCWIPNTDRTGHVWGPASDYYEESLEHADTQVGRILDAINLNRTTVILTADHGMAHTNPDRIIAPVFEDLNTLQALADADIEHKLVNMGGKAFWLWLKNPSEDAQAAVDVLNDQDYTRKLYASVEHENLQGVDASLHSLNIGHEERAGDFFVETGSGWTINFPNFGQHGSTSAAAQNIPFIVAGSGTSSGISATTARLVDLAPTALDLLDVNPSALDAQGRSLKRVISASND